MFKQIKVFERYRNGTKRSYRHSTKGDRANSFGTNELEGELKVPVDATGTREEVAHFAAEWFQRHLIAAAAQ